MGTQKNRLNETVLLSTQTYVKTDGLRSKIKQLKEQTTKVVIGWKMAN